MPDASIDLSNTALAPPPIVGGSDSLGIGGDQKTTKGDTAPKPESKSDTARYASEEYFSMLHPRDSSSGTDISRPPELPKPLKPPQPEEANPVAEWGNSMSAMIALFGSALTRTPIRTALNAAAAGINAQRQGDMAKYKQQLELWKDNSDYVQKLAEWQQNAYKQAVDFSKQTHIDTMMSQMYGVAVATNDEQMRLAVLSGDPKMPFDLMKSREELSTKLNQQHIEMLRLGEEINRDHEHQREWSATHQEAAPFKQNRTQVTGQDTASYVDDILNGVAQGEPVDKVIYQKESGGKDMAPHVIKLKDGTTDEVAGKGNIRKATFDRVKLPTESWDNPKDVAAATDRLMANYQARGWDAGRIATAWISGPNNVTPMGAVQDKTPGREFTTSQEVVSIGPDGKAKQVLGQQDIKTGNWVTADGNRTPIRVTGISGKEAPEPGDVSVEQTAKLIAGYKMAPLSAFALRSAWGQQVMARASQINPTYDATQFTAKNKAVSAFDTGKQGDQTRSLNVAIQHLHLMDDLSAALENKDMQKVNSIRNQLKEEFGNSDVTNFDVAKGIVGDEIVKAVITGGGALADRENAQNQLSRAKSWPQLAQATATARKLMAGQLVGLRRQYQSSTGLKDFNQKLEPETISELENITSGGKALPKGAGTRAAPATPQTNQDYDDLISGAYYIDPDDHKLYQKP